MNRVNYLRIIHKYIPPDSPTYAVYIPHVAAVTAKAMRIAHRMGLSPMQLRFIEEASMLHDIGIVQVNAPQLNCTGTRPYLAHLVEGRRILEAEGLPAHALVAERHVSVGILREEVLAQGLPLPPRDFAPRTLEERLISWADIFFSKLPGELWREKSWEEARSRVGRYGERQKHTFDAWLAEFAPYEGRS